MNKIELIICKIFEFISNSSDEFAINSKILHIIKGTLMQIWKSHYMFAFIWKQCPENFAFLIPRIVELFARKVCKFLKM